MPRTDPGKSAVSIIGNASYSYRVANTEGVKNLT